MTLLKVDPARFIDYSQNTAKSSQLIHYVNQASHGFVNGDVGSVLRFTASGWVKAKADASTTLGVAILVSRIDADNIIVGTAGIFNIGSHGFSTGEYLFLSDSTSGAFTPSQPSLYSNPLAQVMSSTEVYLFHWRPSLTADGSNITNQGLKRVGLVTASGGESVLQVTGLDLDSKKSYKIRYNISFQGTSGSTTVFVTFNDDTSQTGYAKEAPNNGSTYANNNDSRLDQNTLAAGNVRAGIGELFWGRQSTSGGGDKYPGFTYALYGNALSPQGSIYKGMGTDNVTKFALRMSGTLTFGDNSYLEIFEYA